MIYLSKTTHLFLCVFATLIFISCDDLNPQEIQEDQEEVSKAVSEISKAQQSFTDSYRVLDEAARQLDDLNGFTGPIIAQNRGCDDIELSTDPMNTFPAVLVIDFGDNCNQNGHSFTGKMQASFDGPIFEEGKGMLLTFSDFTIDGLGMTGSYQVRNVGNNASGQFNSEHTIAAGKMTDLDGNEFKYSGLTTSTMIEGQDTDWASDGEAGLNDDVWEEEEDGIYINSEGVEYTITTTTPTRRLVACEIPVSGVIEFESETLSAPISIDFGDGTCDRKIKVSMGLLSFEMDI